MRCGEVGCHVAHEQCNTFDRPRFNGSQTLSHPTPQDIDRQRMQLLWEPPVDVLGTFTPKTDNFRAFFQHLPPTTEAEPSTSSDDAGDEVAMAYTTRLISTAA